MAELNSYLTGKNVTFEFDVKDRKGVAVTPATAVLIIEPPSGVPNAPITLTHNPVDPVGHFEYEYDPGGVIGIHKARLETTGPKTAEEKKIYVSPSSL